MSLMSIVLTGEWVCVGLSVHLSPGSETEPLLRAQHTGGSCKEETWRRQCVWSSSRFLPGPGRHSCPPRPYCICRWRMTHRHRCWLTTVHCSVNRLHTTNLAYTYDESPKFTDLAKSFFSTRMRMMMTKPSSSTTSTKELMMDSQWISSVLGKNE